jgi:hypothetical protein
MATARRDVGTWLVVASCVSVCGCMGSQPSRPVPRIKRGGVFGSGPPVVRIVSGLGSFRLGTSDDDLGWGRGRAVHVGAGYLYGGGLRFMDFDLGRPSGGDYHVETVLGYFGAGVTSGHPYGGGAYCGIGLGSAEIEAPGMNEDDFALALAGGLVGYANTPHFAVGVVGEIGVLFAEPAGVDLDGVTFTVGIYASY